MRKILSWAALLALVGALEAPVVLADSLGLAVQRVDASQFPTMRVYVSVANPNGVPITGLTAEAFQVQEDGKPVDGLQVEPLVDSQEPIATALVIDTSGSMADENKLDHAREAASAFIDSTGGKDRVTIVAFSSQVSVIQDYAADRTALKAALGTLNAKGDTLLYDAVAQTARRQAAQAERRKALILLTDGEDTKSSASLDSSIAAAVSAGSPIFAIGLGSDVNKEVLDRLASATGGQAIYLDDPTQLKPTLLSIGDQLRRQYALRYTSKLAPGDQPHGVAVQVQYSGQQVTGLGSFSTPAAPTITVVGLTSGAAVTGVQHVQVDVNGGAAQVQLLVDDQPRGSLTGAPFVFDWDTRPESPGPHKVVVRVNDTRGGSTDKLFNLNVVAPAVATTAPQPTAQSVPTAVPQDTTPSQPVAGTPLAAILALLVLLLLLGLGAVYVATRPRRGASPAVPDPRPDVPLGDTDRTLDIDPELTMAPGGNRDATLMRSTPRARLLIMSHGEQREVSLSDSDTIVGRDERAGGVALKDSLASRQHAKISRQNNQYWIEDMHSLNGTQLNGQPVTRSTLTNNDRISIGETVLTFLVESR
ncbi:MAG TPA: VWA domain-containing protein [Chloroflexota bacterium]|nr:VWA domain-containing protein [Chloroflexota bacterium]